VNTVSVFTHHSAYVVGCVQALQLQKEVELRRKELEYRFTAHAADAIDAIRSQKKSYKY